MQVGRSSDDVSQWSTNSLSLMGTKDFYLYTIQDKPIISSSKDGSGPE